MTLESWGRPFDLMVVSTPCFERAISSARASVVTVVKPSLVGRHPDRPAPGGAAPRQAGGGTSHALKAVGGGTSHALKALGRGTSHVFKAAGRGTSHALKAVGE
ncbi:hypothetical protein Sm713_34960 [Streptomyces sp. TS71-3]|nr:hypothetical protein Sm713_34960 [Streptomyces sp. TS71-3]